MVWTLNNDKKNVLMDTQSEIYIKYQKLVEGKNINPQTLLATDYLNHFNEVHMLLGMISDMPDFIDDILDWEAISYQKHFELSVLPYKDLAIEAYEHSPHQYKNAFEDCVSEMDQLLLSTISLTVGAIKRDNFDQVTSVVGDYTPKMEVLIEQCSTIINSKDTSEAQDNIDELFEAEDWDGQSDAIDQDSIDDLFD